MILEEPKKIKSVTVSIFSPSICHEVMGTDAMILVFWMLKFKSAFSLSSFTFTRLLCSSLLFARRVVSSAYLKESEVAQSCPTLCDPMDGGARWAAVHGVKKSRTRLSNFTFTFHFHALEKEMATHSSVLAWRIPGTGSHRVGHDWSDAAAAAAAAAANTQMIPP